MICTGRTRVLLDCGLGLAEIQRRMARIGVDPADLHAIVVTHEHGDHIGGVSALVRRFHLPVWMTKGTLREWRDPLLPYVQVFSPHTAFVVHDLRIEPYPVPHDAREPCQYVFNDGRFRLGVCSDAGSVTPHMRAVLDGCDGLLLEFNHDSTMLRDGPYPPKLKQRVGGGFGHLSNRQASDLLRSIDCTRLQHLVLTHLSEHNNTPELALAAALAARCCSADRVVCASQADGLWWRELA